MNKSRVLSGVNPSSRGLHIGNYFGAIKHFAQMQDSRECFFFVADLHSLNTVFDPQVLRENALNVYAEYLSLGIDPDKSTFFFESDILEIPYLHTILNNVVTVGELQRMHGYKDKLAHAVDQGAISAGLFEYPVLMASDILLFDAEKVPVGEDQRQHVEVAREIARTYNRRYGEVFVIPQVEISTKTSKIVGIDGKRKMSKSLGNDIPIFASLDTLKQRVMQITTDPSRIKASDPGDPSLNICFNYLALLGYDTDYLSKRYTEGKVGDVEIKHLLFEQIVQYFAPHRQRKSEIMSNSTSLIELRHRGADKARSVASATLSRVKTSCGLL